MAGAGRRLSVEVFTSPGGYILGEESALIECMEGHRGEPRNKPPFPGVYGLWGQPTLMNSVETFAHVPVIASRGARGGGSRALGGTGLKFFAVSGHVERPGVYCVPMGSTARQLLDLAGGVSGGRALGAIQPGGASSNFLGPDGLDVPLDFDPLAEAGLDARLGRAGGAWPRAPTCSPRPRTCCGSSATSRAASACRAGSAPPRRTRSSPSLLAAGGGPGDVDGRITELEETMRRTSICGLGQVALGPVMSVMRLSSGAGD